jgi:hypothetical protein
VRCEIDWEIRLRAAPSATRRAPEEGDKAASAWLVALVVDHDRRSALQARSAH